MCLDDDARPQKRTYTSFGSNKTIPNNKRSSVAYFNSLLDDLTIDKALQRHELLLVNVRFYTSINFHTVGLIRKSILEELTPKTDLNFS